MAKARGIHAANLMNFGNFKSRIRGRLREGRYSDGASDPLTLERHIMQSARDVAEMMDGAFDTRTHDISSGTALVCMPDLYRLNTLHIQDASGNWLPLRVYDSPGELDARTRATWRNDTGADPPDSVVLNGLNSMTLNPTPSVSRTGAFVLEGWFKPSDTFWVYDTAGTGVALADSHECPLPSWAHDAVLALALYRRATDDQRPEVRQNIPEYEKEMEDRMGTAHGKAMEFADRLRGRGPRAYGRGRSR